MTSMGAKLAAGPLGSGANGTLHSSGANGTLHSSGANGTLHSSGANGTLHSSGANGTLHSDEQLDDVVNGSPADGALRAGQQILSVHWARAQASHRSMLVH